MKKSVLVLSGSPGRHGVGVIFGKQGVMVANLARPAVRATLTIAGKHPAIRLIGEDNFTSGKVIKLR